MLFANKLAAAARACEVNFNWLALQHYRPVTMLDFDVICGALPTVAAHKALLELKDQSHQGQAKLAEEGDTPLNALTGPSTLRFHLHNLNDFTLPHGSAAELLAWKGRLSGHLSARSRRFVELIGAAAKVEDPASLIVQSRAGINTVSELLRAEIKSFEDEYNDLTLLDQLLDRALPIEDLARKSSRESKSGEAFRMVLNHLQMTRPNSQNNNLNDAINVSLLVRLFNSPALTHSQRQVPILISGTRSLAEFSYPSQWFYLSSSMKHSPDFIQDRLYLVVTQSLLAFNENRYRSVIDSASLLAEQADELAEAFRALIEATTNNKANEVSLQWELAQHKQKIFQDEWTPIFEPAVSSAQLDRTLYSNLLLLTPDLTRQFETGEVEDVRKGINKLIEDLQRYRHPIFDHWQSESALSSWGHKTDRHDREGIGLLFDLSVVENDGTLLSELDKGKQITPQDNVDNKETGRDLRYILHLKADPIGAILAIDCWDDGPRFQARRLGVVWKHKMSAVTIWEEGIGLLRACYKPDRNAHFSCSYRLFMRSTKIEDQTTLAAASNVMAGKPERALAVQYFEAQVGPLTFFADVKPLDDIEMQAGLVMDRNLWRAAIGDALARVIAETSVVTLTSKHYAAILKFIAGKIGM